MTPNLLSSRGVALLIALLMMSVFSALGLALVLSTTLDRMAAANHAVAVELLNASDAAIELSARELARITDWDAVLAGSVRSTLVDGTPGRRLIAAGTEIDLIALTNRLTCGSEAACTDAQVQAFSPERPWGANNPRWQLFLHLPLQPPGALPRDGHPVYVAVWIGDDARETDGDPRSDGAGAGEEGRYIVRARAESFGPDGARHAIEAELGRVCDPEAADRCLPGIRVQSWRAVTAVVP